MTDEKYITIKELAELKGVSTRAIRLSKGKYITRDIIVKGGKSFEILLSSIEPELQEKYYSKFVPIIQKMNTLKQPLNTILTGNEQQKNSLKRKIRKDFYKIKQEMGLKNYKLDDLRFCNKIDN